ncbi:hypothetical protein MUP77_23725, partial [Candidatus Bathyarchaeota archaeon]|nr:hypothetical protein [Candidatus Bathyarchaeota archaeon]
MTTGLDHSKLVYVDTSAGYACEEARLDTQKLINLIRQAHNQETSLVSTNDPKMADIIILHCCGHLRDREIDSVNTIKKIRTISKKSAQLIVWGCLPVINPRSLEKVYDGPVIGPDNFGYFANLFGLSEAKAFDVYANTLCYHNQSIDPEMSPGIKRVRLPGFLKKELVPMLYSKREIAEKTWYIKILNGCKNHCTYCSDRLAFEQLKSKPLGTIVEEFGLGLKKGYELFWLVGRDLGSYGHDIGLSLVNL